METVLDPDRSIYEEAPLTLVAFQINFPPVPDLDPQTPQAALLAALKERYPILAGPATMQLDIGVGGPRPRGAKLTNRERTWAISMTSEWIVLETSRYKRYEKFAEQVDWILERVHEHVSIPAVTRLGLRYIDEIIVEGTETLEAWKPWITWDLIAGGMIEGFDTREYLVQATIDVADLQHLVVRYGRVSQPAANPTGTLRIANSPTEPYFLLDVDSFWEPSTDEFREFSAEEVRAVTLQLHDPVRDVFERAITDALRERFKPVPTEEVAS
jgi:uncharacterized protein (TIGR04255 family)